MAPLMPELVDVGANPREPAAVEPEQAPSALFDAVTAFVVRLSSDAPFLIVLDGLHQDHAARPEAESVLSELPRGSRRMVLRGLDEDAVGSFIEHHGLSNPSAALVAGLHRMTEGNPFISDDLVRPLISGGRLTSETPAGLPVGLPDTVREAILSRLEPLGERARAVLTTASVIGRQFSLATLQRAAGIEREELLAILDAATTKGVIREVPGAVGQLSFAHRLFNETLYACLSPRQRMREHVAVGRALEQMRARSIDDHLAELAHHFVEAAPAGDTRKALDYAARAGHQALRSLAYERACNHFEDALRVLDFEEPQNQERDAELLCGLGRARLLMGHPESRQTIDAAAAAARQIGDPELLAQAGLSLRGFALTPGVVDGQFVRMLDEALELLDPVDTALRAQVMVSLAEALYWSETDERRETLLEEAVSMARRVDDPATLDYVLSHGVSASRGTDTTERGIEWAEELARSSAQPDHAVLEVVGRSARIDLFLEVDDLAGADIALEDFYRLADEVGDPRARSLAPMHRGRRALMEGRCADAEARIAEGMAIAARLADSTTPMIAGAQQYVIRWYQGRLGELEPAIRQAADSFPAMRSWRAALAMLYRESGREAEARREFERLAKQGFGSIPRNNVWFVAMALLSEVCHFLGDRPRARELYELLVPYRSRNVVAPISTCLGPVARYLGLLATTQQEWGAAESHFAAARDGAERLAARPTISLLCTDEARALLARAEPGDLERAQQLVAEADALAGEMELDGLRARSRALETAVGAVAAEAKAPPARTAEPVTGILTREAEFWTFELEGRVVRVRDAKGVRHIALLLGSPGVEVHVLDIAAATEGRVPALAAGADLASAHASGLHGDVSAGGDVVLDSEAKAAYRARLDDLREEMAEAESFHDPERAARAREEIDFLAHELASAVGLGGRDRRAMSDAERARVNVSRAIKSVLRRVTAGNAALGRELSTTIHTGIFCRYDPDPRRPVTWRVEAH